MGRSNDSSTWSQLARVESLEQLVSAFQNPAQFQIELAELLQSYGSNFASPTVIEVGSANGITSALLPNHYSKTLLDFSPTALEQAKILFKHLEKNVELIEADILNVQVINEQYDMVFSAGLIEHFKLNDRTKIVENMFHLAKPNGYIVIAVPNHHSIPYRVGYLYNVMRGTWIYPPEERISHLKRETEAVRDFIFVCERTLDKHNAFHFLPSHLNRFFRLLDRWIQFGSYLKVWIYQKR